MNFNGLNLVTFLKMCGITFWHVAILLRYMTPVDKSDNKRISFQSNKQNQTISAGRLGSHKGI